MANKLVQNHLTVVKILFHGSKKLSTSAVSFERKNVRATDCSGNRSKAEIGTESRVEAKNKMSNQKLIRGAKQTILMHKNIGPRKSPKQERSREKYQKILDVTFETIVEIGYENTTTDIIAERCGISVGSLYQFFPNKETIVFTKAEELYLQLHEQFFQKIKSLSKKYTKFSDGLVLEILSAFEKTLEEVSDYSVLHSILYTHPSLLELDHKSNERFAKSLVSELLVKLFPKLNKNRALVLALITVESVDAVYRSLIRDKKQSKSKKKLIIQELDGFLSAYFKSI